MDRITRWLALAATLFASGLFAAPPTLNFQLVANQLSNVTCIANARDGSGRLFITQQNGLIKVFDGTNVLATPFLDISALVHNSGEQGLLGLAFHPGYSTNGYFYVYYSHTSGNSNIVARYTASPPATNIANVASRFEIISLIHTNQQNHNGGDLQFGPDGYLYIAPGDGGGSCDNVLPNNAQNLSTLLGKMLRLDVNNFTTNYIIPATNPFIATNGARPEIWGYGLRNPWRFSFDRLTGDLFIADVGQDQREEVDFQAAGSPGGQNYGWRVYEGTIFSTQSCPTVTVSNIPNAVFPVLEYDHSGSRIAIVGGYRYRGTKIPSLAGAYLFADEKGSGPIYGATQSVAGVWSFAMTNNTPYTITTFGEDEAGELYFSHYATSTAGAIYRIVWKDTDGDGLPDDWEQQYFGSPTGATASADSDGDGFSNLQEFLAGTDPTNASSALRITAITPQATNYVVSFTSATNKLYQLERSNDLTSNSWTVVTNNVTGTGGVIPLIDVGAASVTNRFYRVRLRP